MPLIRIDRLIKLGEVERILSRILMPVPSRHTLIAYIDNGTLCGRKFGRGNNYYVYESSLNDFVQSAQAEPMRRLAA